MFEEPVVATASGVPPVSATRYTVDEVVNQVVPFAEAGRALAAWDANPAAITKIHVEL